MKDLNDYKIGLCFALFSIVVFIVTGFFSLSAYNSSKDFEKQFAYSIQVLKQDIGRLESHIEEFGNLMKEKQLHLSTSNLKDDTKASSVIMRKAKKEKTNSQSEKLKKIEEIMKSTGLDRLAVRNDIDPEVIQELYEIRSEEKKIQSQLNYFREKIVEQRQYDKDKYDEELNDLYQRALPRRFGDKISDEERENAFNELMDKYPDSYAAAKVVSVKAIISARNSDIERAEKYYNMLVDMQDRKTDRVMLNNGLEAMPTVGHVLVRSYYRSGRTEELKMMVKSLEENYYDSLYRIRSPNGPRLVNGEEAIAGIRRRTGIEQ